MRRYLAALISSNLLQLHLAEGEPEQHSRLVASLEAHAGAQRPGLTIMQQSDILLFS